MSAADAAASARRIRAVSSGSCSVLPQSPGVMVTIASWGPRPVNRASVPPAGLSRRSARLVDESLPGIALLVPQRDDCIFGHPAQRAPLAVAEAIDDGVVGIAHSRSAPDVAVFVLQLDVIAVAVPV